MIGNYKFSKWPPGFTRIKRIFFVCFIRQRNCHTQVKRIFHHYCFIKHKDLFIIFMNISCFTLVFCRKRFCWSNVRLWALKKISPNRIFARLAANIFLGSSRKPITFSRDMLFHFQMKGFQRDNMSGIDDKVYTYLWNFI